MKTAWDRRVARKDMRPGQMFVFTHPELEPWCRDVWVVIDSKREVGFWHGTQTCTGEVAPSSAFEVVSG